MLVVLPMDTPHHAGDSPPPAGAGGGTDATRGGVKRRASAAAAMLELESALEVGVDSLAGLVGAVTSFGVEGQADLFAKVYVRHGLFSGGCSCPASGWRRAWCGEAGRWLKG